MCVCLLTSLVLLMIWPRVVDGVGVDDIESRGVGGVVVWRCL